MQAKAQGCAAPNDFRPSDDGRPAAPPQTLLNHIEDFYLDGPSRAPAEAWTPTSTAAGALAGTSKDSSVPMEAIGCWQQGEGTRNLHVDDRGEDAAVIIIDDSQGCEAGALPRSPPYADHADQTLVAPAEPVPQGMAVQKLPSASDSGLVRENCSDNWFAALCFEPPPPLVADHRPTGTAAAPLPLVDNFSEPRPTSGNSFGLKSPDATPALARNGSRLVTLDGAAPGSNAAIFSDSHCATEKELPEAMDMQQAVEDIDATGGSANAVPLGAAGAENANAIQAAASRAPGIAMTQNDGISAVATAAKAVSFKPKLLLRAAYLGNVDASAASAPNDPMDEDDSFDPIEDSQAAPPKPAAADVGNQLQKPLLAPRFAKRQHKYRALAAAMQEVAQPGEIFRQNADQNDSSALTDCYYNVFMLSVISSSGCKLVQGAMYVVVIGRMHFAAGMLQFIIAQF